MDPFTLFEREQGDARSGGHSKIACLLATAVLFDQPELSQKGAHLCIDALGCIVMGTMSTILNANKTQLRWYWNPVRERRTRMKPSIEGSPWIVAAPEHQHLLLRR